MPSTLGQDRLISKEVLLGVIRDYQLPSTHIGLTQIAPFYEVQSDDVIFDYTRGLVDGLAPARAEDSESELAQKDDSVGQGRAAIIDWALKDHYDPSDISRYREALAIGGLAGAQNLPLAFTGRMTDEFETKVARDTLIRRRKLDNRLEWLIMTALETGQIVYNDGKIKFTVDYGRPADQTDEAPTGGLWTLTTSDPITAILDMQELMFTRYGIRMTRAIGSRKAIRNILNSDKFAARSGLAGATGSKPIDPKYLIDGWGVEAAVNVVERATGVVFQQYDTVYRTRAFGSNTVVNNRFVNENKVIFLPSQEDVNAIYDADLSIGFAKTLTSPHPEGNWTSGYYEWEKDTGPDPWGHDYGNGIKAFPVFPHMEFTYTMAVLP